MQGPDVFLYTFRIPLESCPLELTSIAGSTEKEACNTLLGMTTLLSYDASAWSKLKSCLQPTCREPKSRHMATTNSAGAILPHVTLTINEEEIVNSDAVTPKSQYNAMTCRNVYPF